MRLSVNAVIQLLALIAQGINVTLDILPPRGRVWAAVALSVLQGLIGVLAHFRNPDGTPVELPYTRK